MGGNPWTDSTTRWWRSLGVPANVSKGVIKRVRENFIPPSSTWGTGRGVHPPASLNFPFSSWLAAIFISHYHSSSSAVISKCQYTRGKKLRGRHFPPRQRRRRFFHGQLGVELWGGHGRGVVQRKISSSRPVLCVPRGHGACVLNYATLGVSPVIQWGGLQVGFEECGGTVRPHYL